MATTMLTCDRFVACAALRFVALRGLVLVVGPLRFLRLLLVLLLWPPVSLPLMGLLLLPWSWSLSLPAFVTVDAVGDVTVTVTFIPIIVAAAGARFLCFHYYCSS